MYDMFLSYTCYIQKVICIMNATEACSGISHAYCKENNTHTRNSNIRVWAHQ